jgi:thiol-disulfide isomerase/thioredoxin
MFRLVPPQSQQTTPRWYHDEIPFQLAAGEERTLKFIYSPSNPNAWRGENTIEAVVRECGGKPAAGKPFTLNYVVPHGGWLPVLQGVLDNEGRFRLPNVGTDPNGPEFALRIGEEWLRKMRVTEPRHQYFEFTLAPEVNDIAPDVTFLDVHENEDVSLRSLRGHIVYLEFWATWCGPCRLPMIRLNEMMEKRSTHWDGHVDVLAASIDDDPETVKWRVRYEGWTHVRQVWAGAEGQTDIDSPAGQAFGVNGIPMAFLIAPDGRIVWKGHPNRDTDFEAQIDELCRSTAEASDKTK